MKLSSSTPMMDVKAKSMMGWFVSLRVIPLFTSIHIAPASPRTPASRTRSSFFFTVES
ncbi:MAG TPA: hypothetical protein VEU33_14140 [Archangium sp.]|nr:hypothetical protein [Archangium sp.]